MDDGSWGTYCRWISIISEIEENIQDRDTYIYIYCTLYNYIARVVESMDFTKVALQCGIAQVAEQNLADISVHTANIFRGHAMAVVVIILRVALTCHVNPTVPYPRTFPGHKI